jgi:hypothetical protein
VVGLANIMHGKHLSELWVRCILRYYTYRCGAKAVVGCTTTSSVDGGDAAFQTSYTAPEQSTTQEECELRQLPWQYTL